MPCKITANVTRDCDDFMNPGVRDRVILVNHDDFKLGTPTWDATNPMLMTNFTLPIGIVGYAYELQGWEPNVSLAGDPYQDLFLHQLRMRIHKDDPATKEQVLNLIKGRVVAFVETNNDRFEVYGKDSGLRVSEYADNRTDPGEVGFNILLATKNNDRESLPPVTLFDTDFATTKTIVDDLLISA